MLTSTPSTRLVTTDLNLLITPVEWQQLVEIIPQQLTGEGFMVTKISATEVSLTCEPDNMLVNQFEQAEGRSAVGSGCYGCVAGCCCDYCY